MELVVLKIDSPEWNFAWNWLANHPINQGLEEPKVAENNGFVWEYMGSFKNGNKLISQFRHKEHPFTNRLCNTSVEHMGFDIDNIQNSAKIK